MSAGLGRIGARFEQRLNDFDVARPDGENQRRIRRAIPYVRVGTRRGEHAHDIRMAGFRSFHERRTAESKRRVERPGVAEQGRQRFRRTRLGRPVQGADRVFDVAGVVPTCCNSYGRFRLGVAARREFLVETRCRGSITVHAEAATLQAGEIVGRCRVPSSARRRSSTAARSNCRARR